MKAKSDNIGFTLIELMIVVAIVAILAGIALPSYRDYVVRAKVSEGVDLAKPAKTAISEYYTNKNSFPSSNTEAGLPTDLVSTSNLTSNIQVGASGVITITFGSGSGVENKTLLLTPSADSTSKIITWSCTDPAATLETKYRPANCR